MYDRPALRILQLQRIVRSQMLLQMVLVRLLGASTHAAFPVFAHA